MLGKFCKYIIFLLLCAFSASSCQMFHPLNTDIPLLEQKGDLHVDAGFSFTPLMDGQGLSGTVSYAPLDHLALQCAGSFSADHVTPDNEEGDSPSEPFWKSAGYHFQFAAGTFHPVGRGILEAYLGFARGNVFHGHGYSEFQHTNLYYGQLNYGWNHLCKDRIDVGLGFKVGALKPHWTPEITSGDNTAVFFEPQAVFRVGGPHLKFSFILSAVSVSGMPNDESLDGIPLLSIEMGIHYKF